MNTSTERPTTLDVIARVLIRCFAIGCAILLFWLVVFLAADELIYSVHGKIFHLSKHEIDLINYGGMGLFKMASAMFFLVPYLAIRWTQRTL